MISVIFQNKGAIISIQCNLYEKWKDIINKYKAKAINEEINNVYYLYNGKRINEELLLEEIINNVDKNQRKMNVLIYDIYERENKNMIESNEIICQICKEIVIIKIEDYKIEMKCKNNHKNIISIKDYNNKIDITKIKCNNCNKNRSEIYNNVLFICLNCNINLCPICKTSHDKNHRIIEYEDKKYKCNKHNEIFTKYCCGNNICIECENEHKNHKNIYYGDILPTINNNDIKEFINKLNNEINEIINILNNVKNNLNEYYNLYNKLIQYYNNYKKKNYEILQNINEFEKFNKIIIKDIKEIINEKEFNNKFKYINNIYNKINNINKDNNINNYILSEIEIKDETKKYRIINSYDEYRRRNKREVNDFEKNEKEIKDNIEIEINSKIIPFSYFYKFKEKGKYKIKYIFKKNNLKNICFLFCECSALTNIDLSNFNTQNITNMRDLFMRCSSLININLSNFNTQKVTNMSDMFFGCSSLNSINLSNFNTQNVIKMGCMFSQCYSLKNLNLSNFNTQKVIDMNRMFCACNSLLNIDLSNFNTQNVTDMTHMFNGCSSLTNIDLSSFNTKKVESMYHMFFNCLSLVNINLINFNTENTTNIESMFGECSFLKKNNIITKDKKILNLF